VKSGVTFNGTGAAVYLCVGVIPDRVAIRALEDGDMGLLLWNRSFREGGCAGGFLENTGTTYIQRAVVAAGAGVEPYEGGDILTTANQTSTGYGEGVYLGWDDADYKADQVSGFQGICTDYTKDSANAGHFNVDTVASGNKVGEGSEILVMSAGKLYCAVITALTAGQGISASEVTLSRTIPSGKVLKVGGMYDLAPLAVGKVTPAGIKLNMTTVVNVNDEIQSMDFDVYDIAK